LVADEAGCLSAIITHAGTIAGTSGPIVFPSISLSEPASLELTPRMEFARNPCKNSPKIAVPGCRGLPRPDCSSLSNHARAQCQWQRKFGQTDLDRRGAQSFARRRRLNVIRLRSCFFMRLRSKRPAPHCKELEGHLREGAAGALTGSEKHSYVLDLDDP